MHSVAWIACFLDGTYRCSIDLEEDFARTARARCMLPTPAWFLERLQKHGLPVGDVLAARGGGYRKPGPKDHTEFCILGLVRSAGVFLPNTACHANFK